MGFIVKSLAMQAAIGLGAIHFAHRFGYVALVVVAFFTFGAVISWVEKRAI